MTTAVCHLFSGIKNVKKHEKQTVDSDPSDPVLNLQLQTGDSALGFCQGQPYYDYKALITWLEASQFALFYIVMQGLSPSLSAFLDMYGGHLAHH